MRKSRIVTILICIMISRKIKIAEISVTKENIYKEANTAQPIKVGRCL